MIATDTGLIGLRRLHRPLEIKPPVEQARPTRKGNARSSWPSGVDLFAAGLLLNPPR